MSQDQLNILKFLAHEASQLDSSAMQENDGTPYSKKQPKILKQLSAEKLFRNISEHGPHVGENDVVVAPYSSLTLLEHALKTMPGEGNTILCPEGFYKATADHVHAAGCIHDLSGVQAFESSVKGDVRGRHFL